MPIYKVKGSLSRTVYIPFEVELEAESVDAAAQIVADEEDEFVDGVEYDVYETSEAFESHEIEEIIEVK